MTRKKRQKLHRQAVRSAKSAAWDNLPVSETPRRREFFGTFRGSTHVHIVSTGVSALLDQDKPWEDAPERLNEVDAWVKSGLSVKGEA